MNGPLENITELTMCGRRGLARHVNDAFQSALAERSDLDPAVLDIEGMSGTKYRHFINNLIRALKGERYLEVGSWAGSTLCSAINGNSVRATAIDNWSQFGGPKHRFLENLERFKTENALVDFIEDDFRRVDYGSLGKFAVYLFDGPHEYEDQYDGLSLALPALKEQFIFIVDDWNWPQVRRGTLQAISDVGVEMDYALEIRTTLDESHPEIAGEKSDWHNGYLISVLSKPRNTLFGWLGELMGPGRRRGK